MPQFFGSTLCCLIWLFLQSRVVSQSVTSCNKCEAEDTDQTWNTAEVGKELRFGSAKKAIGELQVKPCQMVVLMFEEGQELDKNQKKKRKGFDTMKSYCVSNSNPGVITVMNDAKKKYIVKKDKWMVEWKLKGEVTVDVTPGPRDDSAGCVDDMLFGCVKNMPKVPGAKEVMASYQGKEWVSEISAEACEESRFKGYSTWLRQVKGVNGCGEFNVYIQQASENPVPENSEKLQTAISWTDGKQAFTPSMHGYSCSAADWSTKPQYCITDVFEAWIGKEWGTGGEVWRDMSDTFANNRDSFCGKSAEQYVPCFLRFKTETVHHTSRDWKLRVSLIVLVSLVIICILGACFMQYQKRSSGNSRQIETGLSVELVG